MLSRKQHCLVTWFVFIAVVAAYVVMAWWYPYAFIWATYEDLYGEWVQFFLFVGAFAFSIVAARRASRYRWFFVVLALACFYTFMEEISWGQRVLDISSPDFFKAKNLQGETNLHNFFVGPFSTNLKQVIEVSVATALVAFGVVYPLFLRLGWWPATKYDAWGIASPPLYLFPLFASAAYLELGLLSYNEAEVAEILIGFSLCVLSLQYAYTLRYEYPVHRDGAWPKGVSARMASYIAATVLCVGALSFATTELYYASDEGRARIEDRIENGLDKFADRYGRIGRWDIAIELNSRLRTMRPTSTPVLRQLARSYLNAGDKEQHDAVLGEALEIDRAQLAKAPVSTTTLRSLARTYRMLGDLAQEQHYLRQALAVGQAQVARNSGDAAAAYSLAKTYSLLNRDTEAFELYKRAVELRPTSRTYQKAYLRQKLKLETRPDWK